MKIRKEHIEHMKAQIDKLLEISGGVDFVVSSYERGAFPHSEKVKDLQYRFCFDLLYGAGLTPWVCSEIYLYANDNHLYTALKSICPIVVKKY